MLPSLGKSTVAAILALSCWASVSFGVAAADQASCQQLLENLALQEDEGHPLQGIRVSIHRNGEPEPCGSTVLDLSAIGNVLEAVEGCDDMDKYQLESFLTQLFAEVLEKGACGSTDNSTAPAGLLGHCDMGPLRTPILLDHQDLVRVPSGSLPCRFHTREGLRIASLEHWVDLSRQAKAKTTTCDEEEQNCVAEASPEIHLYAVPAGRVFMLAPSFVGEIFDMPHVDADTGLPVSLEVISLVPRVFDIKNFFTREEAEELIRRAVAETSPSHRFHRSTTGTSENAVIQRRTSENAFDTHGATARKLKRRCFSVLGFDTYYESHADGLQILRYNETKAYSPHMDYFEDRGGRELFDFVSSRKGGNRFATILLYMNDLGENDGGETVFPHGWPVGVPENERLQTSQALKQLRASGDASMLDRGSWEEEMVANCRSRLSIKPSASRAVLFYSMHPNGAPDYMSLHGGCPVLKGEKLAANLWVWNTPRKDMEGAPVNEYAKEKKAHVAPSNGPKQVRVQFLNTGKDPAFEKAELFFDEDVFWGKFGHDDPPLRVNSSEGHRWNVKVDGKVAKTFVIGNASSYILTV